MAEIGFGGQVRLEHESHAHGIATQRCGVHGSRVGILQGGVYLV